VYMYTYSVYSYGLIGQVAWVNKWFGPGGNCARMVLPLLQCGERLFCSSDLYRKMGERA
jgi:hypothetical protein